MLSGVVHIEDTETAWRLGTALPFTPGLECHFADIPFVVQVVRIKVKRLGLRIEDASGERTLLAGSSLVAHIDDSQIPCTHQVPNVFACCQKFPFALDNSGLFANRSREFIETDSLFSDRCRICRTSQTERPQFLVCLRKPCLCVQQVAL